MDGTTLCPKCRARMWLRRNEKQRCVCGYEFIADVSDPFLTAKDKIEAQGGAPSARGPQPVDKPAPAKRRGRKARG